jgi:aryl-alcohol dehydrogenase-like predicted oxidoreductase
VQYQLLGQTGVRISRIGVGTAVFGVAPLEADAARLIDRALDLGINYFDTANSYGNQPRFDRPDGPPADQRHAAEEILGRALAGRRHDVVLATKVMERVGAGVNDSGLSRRHIMQQVEASLRRLQTEYIDLYYAHHPDPSTPLEQTLRTFDDLIRQGKVRYAALSTFPAWQMTEALWTCDRLGLNAPVCNQVSYSLAGRAVERELVPACLRFGVSLVIFSPLAGGLLAGVAAAERPRGGAQRWGGPAFSPEQIAIAHRLDGLARAWGLPPAQLALAWLLSRPAVASAVIGPETVAELEANAPAADLLLNAEQLAALDAISHPPT